MAEHDTDPLTPEERAEREELCAEKAQREADERARRERAELAELRAQKAAGASKSKPAAKAAKTASAASSAPERKDDHEDMSFGMRMVSSTEPTGDDDIPGMPPAQKLIIGICLIAVVVFAAYIGLGHAGIIH